MNKLNVLFVSTWPEVTDGISTFCENLAFNMPKTQGGYKVNWEVIRVKRFKQIKNLYKSKIVLDINYNSRRDYLNAAQYINNKSFDLVVIQFINNIYGGEGGAYIFDLIDNLKTPCVVILHSVAMHKTQQQVPLKQKILKGFQKRSVPVVCMSKIARDFLLNKIGMNYSNVRQIYHGAPEFPRLTKIQIRKERKKLGFSNEDFIIYTYGVIREDKGILPIVDATIKLSGDNKNIKLLITGDDPSPKKEFARLLKETIKKRGADKYITYIDKFIPQSEIGKYLQVSDLFITAQKNLGLHSSGTLSYALSAGSAILSTNTFHAKELLSNNKSIIQPNSDSIAEHINMLMNDKKLIETLKKESYETRQKIIWPTIAKQYTDYFIKLIKNK